MFEDREDAGRPEEAAEAEGDRLAHVAREEGEEGLLGQLAQVKRTAKMVEAVSAIKVLMDERDAVDTWAWLLRQPAPDAEAWVAATVGGLVEASGGDARHVEALLMYGAYMTRAAERMEGIS